MKDLISTHGASPAPKRLREMITKVVFAIAVQESRQALTGCLVEITPEELRLVGLDGFRLALQRLHDPFVLPEGKELVTAIVPGHVMNEMSRIMTDEEEMVTFHLDATHLMVVMGDTTLQTTLLAGNTSTTSRFFPPPGLPGSR